jgi:flagellar motor component MotA
VLGVIKTMGSITEPPEILGGMIGGMLVGLLGYTNAELFGWDNPDMIAPVYQSK